MLPFGRPGRSASPLLVIMLRELRGGIELAQAHLACEVGAFKNAAALGKKKKSEANKSRAKEPAARATRKISARKQIKARANCIAARANQRRGALWPFGARRNAHGARFFLAAALASASNID